MKTSRLKKVPGTHHIRKTAKEMVEGTNKLSGFQVDQMIYLQESKINPFACQCDLIIMGNTIELHQRNIIGQYQMQKRTAQYWPKENQVIQMSLN